MELKVEIGFNELLSAIKQLPDNELAILKKELAKKEPVQQETTTIKNSELRELLLKGPVMTDEQYKEYKQTRKEINKWRTKK